MSRTHRDGQINNSPTLAEEYVLSRGRPLQPTQLHPPHLTDSTDFERNSVHPFQILRQKTCERIEIITPGKLRLRKPRSHRRDTWVSLRTKYPHDSRTRQVAHSSPANPGNRSPGVSSEVFLSISAETPHFSENLL